MTSLVHALIPRTLLAGNQSQCLQFGRLPAHRGMVAPHLFGEIDDAQRAGRADPHQQREQGAVDRYARLLDQDVAPSARLFSEVHQVEQMPQRERIRIMCMMHPLQSSARALDMRA